MIYESTVNSLLTEGLPSVVNRQGKVHRGKH